MTSSHAYSPHTKDSRIHKGRVVWANLCKTDKSKIEYIELSTTAYLNILKLQKREHCCIYFIILGLFNSLCPKENSQKQFFQYVKPPYT